MPLKSPQLSAVVSVLLVLGCSNGSESTSQRAKKPGGPGGVGADGGAATSNLTCDEQWTLALKQQRVGSVFVYSGTITTATLANLPISFERRETVTAASDGAISRKIDFSASEALFSRYVEKLKTPQLTLTKDKFLQACTKANGQPVTVSGLGGNISIGALKDETLTLKSGKSLAVKRVDIDVTNVTLGSYNVGSAKAVTYISKSYPVLPLKQSITLNQISEDFLKGAVVSEELVNGLPTE